MKQFVISLTLATNSSGDTTTVYYTDGPGWSTESTDTPASTWIEGRVLDPGSIRRELFSGNKLYGAVRPSFGEIVLANGDAALDGWLAYGIDGQPIIIYYGEEGAAFPSGYTQVLKCYGHALLADFDTVRIRLRDRLALLETPWCDHTFAGTGGIEGDSTMAGQVKPRQWRNINFTPLVTVSASSLIYLVSDRGVATSEQSMCKVYEGGVEITRGSNYSSASDMTSTSPSSGQCRFWFNSDDGPVYVRLGSVPIYDLRGYLSISNNGTYNNPASEIISGVNGPDGAIYVDDPSTTYLDVLDEFAASGPSYFGMTRADAWQYGALTIPGTTAAYTFTQHNARDFRRTPPDSMHAPAWRINWASGQCFPCAAATSATAAMRDILSREGYYLRASYEDASILDKHPTAPTVDITTQDQLVSSAWAFGVVGGRYEDLFMVERDFLALTAPFDADTLALELHDTVEVRIPRFGLSSGKKFRVISIELRLRSREIAFGLWG
jgi:hypothetical protein